MSMLDATERTRPIMEYVRDLENKVRRFRAEERRFHAKWFLFGVVVGIASVSTPWLLRLLR